MDEKEMIAEGLTAGHERRRARRNCKHCGRPNPICDADYCADRLKYSCPFCRLPGIFHANDCVNLGLGPKHPKYRRS